MERERKQGVDEVRLRFDTTYSEAAVSSGMDDDEHEYEEKEQDEYSEDDEDEANLGAPSVAINCSYSINPTSALQRSHHYGQADEDDEQAIEEEEEEEEEVVEKQDEAKQQYGDEELQNAVEEEEDEEAEQETELHHFVAVDASVTQIMHSKTAPLSSNHIDSEDEVGEVDDDTLQLHVFQPHTFQPHAIHIQPAPHSGERKEEEEQQDEAAEEEEKETYGDEEEDGVSELCTVQIHQHSLVTQGGHSQSHWHAVDTPTRTHNDNYGHAYCHTHTAYTDRLVHSQRLCRRHPTTRTLRHSHTQPALTRGG